MFFGKVFLMLWVSILYLSIFMHTAHASTPATLQDYWNGNAAWKLYKVIGKTDGLQAWNETGAHITAKGSTWYLFTRKVASTTASYCPSSTAFGLEVRKSNDHGLTWSAPTDILRPEVNTPAECAATDGDAYFNTAENTWYYLYQCESRDTVWNGCIATRQGSDPMGIFTPSTANPVITSAQNTLWSKICTDATKLCYQLAGGNNVHDAGTFNIFAYDGTYYFVSFHGYDGTNGYRGIAKTNDFVHWIAGDSTQGVPADAVLTKNDLFAWRENWISPGPIGVGTGGTIKDGNYYYTVVEGSDGNLSCNQSIDNWDMGIFRTSSLTSTSWEQYPFRNPIMYSTKWPQDYTSSFRCSLQYMRLFRDEGTNQIFLHVSELSTDSTKLGIYVYALTLQHNLLDNGDLWKCNKDGWNTTANTPGVTVPMEVYRYPTLSSDGNCYMAFNCGLNSACTNGESVYQDVSVARLSRNISYSGKVATEAGGPGNISLALFELGSDGRILATHVSNLSVSTAFQQVNGQIALNPLTTTLRYQLYPQNPTLSYKADEMIVQETTNLIGDTNNDSIVNAQDIINVWQNYSLPSSLLDLDGNGKINALDAMLVVKNFTQ